MMEFMLLIRNEIDHDADWPPEQRREFLRKCEAYIDGLKSEGKLKSAQPLVRDGKIISGSSEAWNLGPVAEDKEIVVGYYHILADDIDSAIAIAQRNPEFEYGTTARVEVRPIKMKEQTTGYVYPKDAQSAKES
jgi:hypothetical protein